MADGADPVSSLDVVLPARLAHPGLTDLAERAAVHDPAQFGPAASARAGRVWRPQAQAADAGGGGAGAAPHVGLAGCGGGAAVVQHAQGALLAQHGQLGLEAAATKRHTSM